MIDDILLTIAKILAIVMIILVIYQVITFNSTPEPFIKRNLPDCIIYNTETGTIIECPENIVIDKIIK